MGFGPKSDSTAKLLMVREAVDTLELLPHQPEVTASANNPQKRGEFMCYSERHADLTCVQPERLPVAQNKERDPYHGLRGPQCSDPACLLAQPLPFAPSDPEDWRNVGEEQTLLHNRGWQTSSLKGQLTSILGFVDHEAKSRLLHSYSYKKRKKTI